MRVMTIHAAKGLEFDEVVLASLHTPWDKAPTGWGMLVTDPSREPDLVGPLLNNQARQWIPELELLKRDNMRRALLDEISGLYVAITRARKGVHCIFDNRVDLTAKPSGAALMARVLGRLTQAKDAMEGRSPGAETSFSPPWQEAGDFGEALADGVPGSDEPFWSVSFGGSASAGSASGGGAGAEVSASSPRKFDEGPLFPSLAAGYIETQSDSKHGADVSARPPSEHFSSSPWAQDPFGDEDIALRGVLVHEFFRSVRSVEEIAEDSIETAHDGARMRAAVLRASVEKATPIDEEVVREVSEMLGHLVSRVGRADSVAEALRVGPDDEVRTEVPFVRAVSSLSPAHRTALIHGRIDRLVLVRDASGRIVRASIIDFKTGAAHATADALDSKVASYRPQLEAYREAVAELWNLPIASVGSALLFVDRDEVVRLA
ncbi:MAG: PD-(D/E)XK nuclease family protein [bacterium]